jgi:Ca2+:H+ antiporter
VLLGHDFIGTEHLLLAMTASPDATVRDAMAAAGQAPESLRERLIRALRNGPHTDPGSERPLRSGARKALDQLGTAADPAAAATVLLEIVSRERKGPVAQALGAADAEGQRRPDGRGGAGLLPPAKEIAASPGEPRQRHPKQKKERLPREPRKPRPEPRIEGLPALHEPEPEYPRGHLRRRKPFPYRLLLLLAVPLSWILVQLHAGPVFIFLGACVAVLPLASLMGEATEHLGARAGPTVGGLLNATFGNAAELIIAIAALRAGQLELVKASITGSILGNLLLILGLSLLAGGMKAPVLRFNRTAAGMSSAMLALAVVGLVFPALFHWIHPEVAARPREMQLSELVAILLGATYFCSLLFSLRTHRDLFAGEDHPVEGQPWSVGKAVGVLAVATAAVAVESEILVSSVADVTAILGLSQTFLGLIVVPVIGNAAEHATAILMARKGKMDLALHVALGSSTQVALLVAPLLVGVGLLLAQPMDLVFGPFEVAAVGLSTLLVALITLDGESHWFEGVQLLALYGMVAAVALVI